MRSLSETLEFLQKTWIEPPLHILDVETRHKSRLLNIFLLPTILIFIGVDGIYLATLPGYRPPWYGYVFLFGSYFLNRSRYYRPAAFLTLAMFPIVIILNIISGEASNPLAMLYYLIPGLLLGGILLSVRTTLIFAVIEVGVILSMPLLAPNAFVGPDAVVGPLSAMILSTLLVMVSMWIRERIEADRRAELSGAEEKYRTIVENAIDGIFQSTPDGGFIRVNPAMARMYGYESPEEMIELVKNISSDLYVEPSLRDDLRLRLASGELIKGFESLDYRKDGSKFWTSMNVQEIRDPYGRILYYEGTVEDITARKSAEQVLRESEERYRTLIHGMLDGIYRSSHDGRFLDVNPAMVKMFGYDSREEMLAVDIKKEMYFAPQERESLFLDTGDEKVDIFRMRRKDGSEIWVEDHGRYVHDQAGKVIYHEGILRDITPRKIVETERARAEEALRQFRILMDESNDAIFLIDPETSQYIDFNRRAHEQLGYSREELGQLGVIDVAEHITNMDVWHRRVELTRESGGLIFESVYHRKDGSTFPVEVSASMLDYENRATLVAIARDITDRKKSEAALRDSEERFRKIFHTSPFAICITTVEEGRLLDANNAYWDLTGYSPEDSIGHNAEDLKMWDDPQERVRFVQELRERHSISNPNDSFHHTDGSLKQVISLYEFILIGDEECILAMFYDMSKQRQLEIERENLISQLEAQNAESETLRESFASIVATFEFTEIVQHILDQIRRVIPYDSASVWRLEGNVQKFISGRDLPSMFLETDVQFFTDETNSALPILRGDVPYILNNNVQEELSDFNQPPHTYVNSWLAIPMKTRGKIIGLIALDGKEKGQFTEHHAALAVSFANQVAIALENARLFNELQSELFVGEKLIQALESKNAELERFTYTVSHDLKSPLVTINGFLGYLEKDAKLGNVKRLKGDVQRIRDAVTRMHRLLSELLELSRIGRLMNQPEMIPFDDLVRETLEIVHGRLEARGVTVQTQPNLPMLYGDRQRLLEVMQNLIDNAAKFMGNQPDPRIEIGQRGHRDGKPVFFVKDNGIGIARDYHERIFGLFDKLDSNSEGTGVGLALVKRIIEVHGGRIWVESDQGQGSTFCFTVAGNGDTKA